jgi:hypothetical protein
VVAELDRAGSPVAAAVVVVDITVEETAGAAANLVDEVATSASAGVTHTVSDAGADAEVTVAAGPAAAPRAVAVPDVGAAELAAATAEGAVVFAATAAASPAPVTSKSIATQRSPVEIGLVMVDIMEWPSAAAGTQTP